MEQNNMRALVIQALRTIIHTTSEGMPFNIIVSVNI